MKIKSDFVTNSSSSSYILNIHSEDIKNLDEFIEQLRNDETCDIDTYFDTTINDVKELREYTEGRELDWASEARGVQYEFLSKQEYEKGVEAIKEGRVLALVEIDYISSVEFNESDWSDFIL